MKSLVWRHKISGIILALLLGPLVESLLISLALMPWVMLSALITVPSLILSLLGVWSGLPALAVGSAACLSTAYMVGGSGAALAVCEACVIPAWAVMLILWRRPRFYQGVMQSAFFHFGALAVLVACLWITSGKDVIEYGMGLLRSMADAMPPQQTSLMLTSMGMTGMLGSETGISFGHMLTQQECARLLDDIYQISATDFRQTLAQTLLVGGMTSGALSYWLCARVAATRGDEPAVSYAHPRDWRLPGHLIIGPAACALACYLAWHAGLSGADAAYIAMFSLAIQLLTVQGMGCTDRFLFKKGLPPGPRRAVIIGLLLLFQMALPVLGAISGLFGSQGLVSNWLKNRNNKGGDPQ